MFLRILNRSESVFLRLLAKSRDIDHLRLAGIVLLAAAALLSAQKTVFGDEYPIGKRLASIVFFWRTVKRKI